MKYLVLAIGIIGILPLSFVLRAYPWIRNKFWILLGTLPFLSLPLPFLDIAIISWDQIWFSYVPGLQISAIDLIAIAIYISLKNSSNSIRYHFPFLLYLLAISLSVLQAEEPLAAIFYVWQFVRIYFFTVVIARSCTEKTVPLQLLKGLAIGGALQFVAVLYQKFGLHIHEPSGTFVHRNTLGLIMHLVVFPHFSLFLAGQRQLQFTLTPLFGLAVASLIASRAAIGFAAFGFAATYLLSFVRRQNLWKLSIGLGGVLMVLAFAPIAQSSLEKRFYENPLLDDQYDERAAFNRTALAMLEENPLGIGANHYSYIGRTRGYSVRSGVADNEGSLRNTVHNAYLLAAAEAGYLGLVAFILLTLYPMFTAFRYARLADSKDPRGDLLLGLGVAMMTAYVHSLFEYIIVIKEVQYVLAIVFGMTFGIAHQIRMEHLARQMASAPRQRPAFLTPGKPKHPVHQRRL
jgi:hypothetical protein